MKLSTKSRYGLRAMINLAENYKKRPLLLKEIAKRENISMKYLDHIISILKSAGYIVRDKNGYLLSKNPQNINTYEIISILENGLKPVECDNNIEGCEVKNICVVMDLWKELEDSIKMVLKKTTLKDLADKRINRGQNE